MKIFLSDISKRYQRSTIFSGINAEFESGKAYALLGVNGSGKSSLMRIIATMQAPSTGKVIYQEKDAIVQPEKVFKHIAFCAPGMEIPDELSLREVLAFHFTFRKPIGNLDQNQILQLTGLEKAADKPISDYSSGMKQRVKLVMAICSDTPVLLLDEPCTNMDAAGVNQYLEWIDRFGRNRLIIVASNDPREYHFCSETITVGNL